MLDIRPIGAAALYTWYGSKYTFIVYFVGTRVVKGAGAMETEQEKEPERK